MYRNYEHPHYPSAQLPGEQISQYSPHWEGDTYVSDREGYIDRDTRKSYRPQYSTNKRFKYGKSNGQQQENSSFREQYNTRRYNNDYDNDAANNYRMKGYNNWNQATRLPQNNIQNQNNFQFQQHSVFYMQQETEYLEHCDDIGHYSRNCPQRRQNGGLIKNPHVNYPSHCRSYQNNCQPFDNEMKDINYYPDQMVYQGPSYHTNINAHDTRQNYQEHWIGPAQEEPCHLSDQTRNNQQPDQGNL